MRNVPRDSHMNHPTISVHDPHKLLILQDNYRLKVCNENDCNSPKCLYVFGVKLGHVFMQLKNQFLQLVVIG